MAWTLEDIKDHLGEGGSTDPDVDIKVEAAAIPAEKRSNVAETIAVPDEGDE